jgi:hypothetical protein
MGTVGLDWQSGAFGNFSSRGTSDMVLRNTKTGGLKVYDIDSNQITGGAGVYCYPQACCGVVDTEAGSIESIGCAAAAEAGHRLHRRGSVTRLEVLPIAIAQECPGLPTFPEGMRRRRSGGQHQQTRPAGGRRNQRGPNSKRGWLAASRLADQARGCDHDSRDECGSAAI